jgi:imidazolonepropionase-like amidohydrolase
MLGRQRNDLLETRQQMRLATPLKVLLALIATWSVVETCTQSQVETLVIEHVTIIDGTGAPAKADMTVFVVGNRIGSIGRSSALRVPVGAQVLDGSGKFLIPGLRDMHVHLGGYDSGKQAFGQLLASGVVGVRDMASPVEQILRLRTETRNGAVLGPAMVVAGPILQRPLPFAVGPLVRTVADEADARRTVDNLKAQGVDFIKVGDTLPRDVYFAIADESKRQGVPFAGHVPPSVSAAEASRAGQRSIEHFGSAGFQAVLIACSSEETALSQIAQDALAGAMTGSSPDATLFGADFTTRLVNTYDAQKSAALFSSFARNGTWQVPTLVALHQAWDSKRGGLGQRDIQSEDRLWAKYTEVLGAMRKAGVRVMAGTDIPLRSGVAPLHEELVQLVKAGIPPMEALQSATRNPAEFQGTLRTEGTVEVGKLADLVLLHANPLVDIANTRRISAVIRLGTLVGPDASPRAR